MMPNIQPLNILCYRDKGQQVAHCLEMDLVAAAQTREAAVRDLADLLRAHVLYAVEPDNLAHLFKPAPDQYWVKLAHARLLGVLPLDLHDELPPDVGGRLAWQRFELRQLAA